MAGKLFLVATPLGNLEDITARALRVLSEVAFIACEDTRHSRRLLTHFHLSKPTVSLPAFAEGPRSTAIVQRLEAGEDGALITDAGSPAISDPGQKLVAQAVARGIQVVPIPGPSAVVAALSASGLPTDRFHFLGFLPRAGVGRSELLEEAGRLSATVVLFESARRLGSTLAELRQQWGDRRACVARELTKIHEEFARGTLSELAARFGGEAPRGEIVLAVEGRSEADRWSEPQVRQAVAASLSRGEKLKSASSEVARLAGWSAKEVYRLGLDLKDKE